MKKSIILLPNFYLDNSLVLSSVYEWCHSPHLYEYYVNRYTSRPVSDYNFECEDVSFYFQECFGTNLSF